jgi:hypothetical protein
VCRNLSSIGQGCRVNAAGLTLFRGKDAKCLTAPKTGLTI